MTDQEIKQQIDRAMQDAITLDYSKWATQQRQAKLSDNHDLWQIERDRTLARQQSDNNEARRKHLASLDAAKAEKRRESDAETDRRLEPQKQTLMREWLANHPDKTAEDFNKSAWIHLRENLIGQEKANALDADIKAQLSTGRYSL
jgi:hypothetical protein